ncbi:MAG: ferritin-like domain-containing protein [Steroidobacteraceae bacterium]|jgi:CDGSH-type Zn-finger protein/uncharacterized Fe-S cluster protein YjdI
MQLNPIHVTRESLLHALYEAAELEHNLMCTYLYAAFSLKSGVQEGLSVTETEAVARWRQQIMAVAVDEMSHLAAVWNITSALGGMPRFGRTNFPLDPGYLPANVVVKLAPFGEAVLQHFIYLERPHSSSEPEGAGFAPERLYLRGASAARLTPMAVDYETVGDFYALLKTSVRALVQRLSESATFVGDPALQLSEQELNLPGTKRVVCLKTALAAFDAIVLQGEGAPDHSAGSHFEQFTAIRAQYQALKAANAGFAPSHPAATNPVLRQPPRPEGRVWLEAEPSIETVDLANAAYGLMLRLLAYSYAVPAPHPDKALAVDLAVGLMRAAAPLGERAARLPAGPSNPHCNAGVSFTALRDAAAFVPGVGARRFFIERLSELASAAAVMESDQTASNATSADDRLARSARAFEALRQRGAKGFDLSARLTVAPAVTTGSGATGPAASAPAANGANEPDLIVDGVETVDGHALTLMFEARRCIHSRFCVTSAPTVFLANVQGPWLHPDTMDAERLVAVAEQCPSGAIRYRRKDGRPDEGPPPVNLAVIREAGPYAIHAPMLINGAPAGFRATLCRCGASKNKPYCDGSHHEAGFIATGEPPSAAKIDTAPVRDGVLALDPQPDGPLKVSGNLEIISGTGRVVARVTTTWLCRCGGSANKPYCDGTHARIGFHA